MSHKVTLIPGDGIGPEVCEATKRVIEAAGIKITWEEHPAGLLAFEQLGNALPQSTIDAIRKNRVALKGPTTTPVGKGHKSANVVLRQALDLYACVRPIKSLKGIETRYDNIDLVIFRENTEGLYAGQEVVIDKDHIISLKIATRKACTRIAEAAFAYAAQHGRKKVTAIHKANIIKQGDGLFLECTQKAAQQYPQIAYEEVIVDAACMHLVSHPERFDVLVMENLYGDILSDLCAGLVGGLGVVPGANIGEHVAIFEAVHGSAPDIAGKGIANPTALIQSGIMMLEHLGEKAAASRIQSALHHALTQRNICTMDVGGCSSSAAFVSAVIERL